MTRPRNIVFDHPVMSGCPFVPADCKFNHTLLPASQRDPAIDANVSVFYPRIHAEIQTSFQEQCKTRWKGHSARMARSDKVLDVYYHLLGILHMSDYAEPTVFYTPTGVAKQLWGKSGPNLQRVRGAVDYMRNTTVIYEGLQPDPGTTDAHLRTKYRILSSQSDPATEVQRGGVNLSWVVYDRTFLEVLKNSLHVQIDVEIMSQLNGIVGKSFYRVLSYLQSQGIDQIEVPELYERVGSQTKRLTSSHATHMFGAAWKTLMQYRYLQSEPDIRPNRNGVLTMHLDYGDPVVLPHKADTLFRTIVDTGVTTAKAVRMVTENPHRAALVLQALKAGALPKPKETLPQLIVGVYDDEKWDIKIPFVEVEPQMDLLDPKKEIVANTRVSLTEASPKQPIDRDAILDWVDLRRRGGGWVELETDILPSLLRAAGERSPHKVLSYAKVRDRLQTVTMKLGWENTIDGLFHAVQYIHNADTPANYIARSLERKAAELFESNASAPVEPAAIHSPIRAVAPAPNAEPQSYADAARPNIDLKAFLRPGTIPARSSLHAKLQSWVKDLDQAPDRMTAKRALQTVSEHRDAAQADPNLTEILNTMERKANEILAA